jgi:hypothetical protein
MWLATKRNAHDEFAGRRVAGGVGSMSLCARRALLAVGGLLLWLAPGVSLVIAVVSRNLVGSIEMLYDKGVTRGADPFAHRPGLRPAARPGADLRVVGLGSGESVAQQHGADVAQQAEAEPDVALPSGHG